MKKPEVFQCEYLGCLATQPYPESLSVSLRSFAAHCFPGLLIKSGGGAGAGLLNSSLRESVMKE